MDPRRAFVTIARLEGVSTLLLFFVAMPMKYVGGMPHATQFPGLLHGLLFVAYVGALAWVTFAESWSPRRVVIGFIASFFPFGTFWFESTLREG